MLTTRLREHEERKRELMKIVDALVDVGTTKAGGLEPATVGVALHAAYEAGRAAMERAEWSPTGNGRARHPQIGTVRNTRKHARAGERAFSKAPLRRKRATA
jgi:hypothetical protein